MLRLVYGWIFARTFTVRAADRCSSDARIVLQPLVRISVDVSSRGVLV
jgi:hypothetical protein